jgi:hypothetical protein
VNNQNNVAEFSQTNEHEQQGTAMKPVFDLSPRSLDEAMRFADILCKSDIVPKDFQNKPGNILVAIQWGMELGLKPMQAMQNIAVINGRPSLWGDAVIALVRNSPLCEYVYETEENGTAICRVKRKGEEEQVRTFSEQDAADAGLLGKQGPWKQYKKRMKQMRARAFALRDVFSDVLKGIPIAEEVMDYQERDITPRPDPRHEAIAQDYPQEEFDKNLPAWKKAILAGKANTDFIATKVETKGQLTDEQRKKLKDIEKQADKTQEGAQS